MEEVVGRKLHFFRGALLPRPFPDGFPVLLGPFLGALCFAILSPPNTSINRQYPQCRLVALVSTLPLVPQKLRTSPPTYVQYTD